MYKKVNLLISADLLYLIEALKVEGYWSPVHPGICIQNKNLPFLRRIEWIVNSIGLPVGKRTLVKIRPVEDDFDTLDVRLTQNAKPLRFHIEKSPFDNSKKIVTSLPYQQLDRLQLTVGKMSCSIEVKEHIDEMKTESVVKVWAYREIRFASVKFQRFLVAYVGDKKKLKVESSLFAENKAFVGSAFSALMDAEESIDYYGFYRRIRIRMYAEKYLKDWQKLLKEFQIKAAFRRNSDRECELAITGYDDFSKLQQLGLQLHHSIKARKWHSLMQSYKRHQIARYSSEEYYAQKLKEINRPVTAAELAMHLHKSKRAVNHYLTLLSRKKVIYADKTHPTYLYSIPDHTQVTATSSVRS